MTTTNSESNKAIVTQFFDAMNRGDVEYIVNAASGAPMTLPLEASVDPDVERLYWFIDERFVGSTARGETFFWNALPGSFEARVVDDSGRADSRRFVVSQVN